MMAGINGTLIKRKENLRIMYGRIDNTEVPSHTRVPIWMATVSGRTPLIPDVWMYHTAPPCSWKMILGTDFQGQDYLYHKILI
jgi:hypothetical protein